jgi:hypothetical protein
MLTKFEVTNGQGDVLSFPLGDNSSGYTVQNIDGLDPVKSTLSSTQFAGVAGAQFQSAQRETRNIKLKLGFDPDPLVDSVGSLRRKLYSYFLPESEIGLTFYDDDGLVVNIAGVVETFDAPLFAQEPVADISIINYDPDFIASTSTVLTGTSTESSAVTVVDYDGDIPVGFVFKLNVNRTLSEVTIYQTVGSDIRSLDYSGPLSAGDVLTISTVPGAKGATLTHLGSTTPVLYGIPLESNWLKMQRGANQLRVYAVGAPIPYSIEYTTRYGGL